MRLALLLAVLPLACLAACDGCVSRGGAPEKGCELDDGSRISTGESTIAADGCNLCVCLPDHSLDCGARSCDDAGPLPNDAGPDEDNDAGPEENDAGPDLGPCHDSDHDGYYVCDDGSLPPAPLPQDLDCDDTRFHVQPNGIEFPETFEDDNCDGSNDDWAPCPCTASATDARDLAGAMDLCGDVVASASKSGAAGQFGNVDAYQGTIGARTHTRDDGPGEPLVVITNGCMATMSTGDAVGTQQGVNAGTCGANDPDPENPSFSSDICDLARLDLTLHAPANASGFSFDFMFLSYEWPEYLCLEYNDTFYAVVRTPAVNGGSPTNTAFDRDGRPITVNVGFFEDPAQWTVPLDGTSFAHPTTGGCPPDAFLVDGCNLPGYCDDANLDVRDGSGSGWLTTQVPITPGQQDLRLTLTIHDESDQNFDSLVLLDGFRWLPDTPDLQTAKDQ
jgi:hypothetical protein